MATASDTPCLGAKMGGLEVTKECELCTSTAPVKYCTECNVQLCPACSRGHGLLKATSDHLLLLLDIGIVNSGSTHAKSGDAESGPSTCIKHPKHTLDFHCTECELLICGECKELEIHKGHLVKSVKGDLQAYQLICRQHIKKLLDKTQELDDHKLLIEGTFRTYEDAIELVKNWEADLVKLVQESSKALRDDLEKEKLDLQQILTDKERGLITTIMGVEEKISTLPQIRKLSDTDIFSQELAASQELLEKVRYFQCNILPKLKVSTQDDLLPGKAQFPIVKSAIKDFMASPNRQGKDVTAMEKSSVATSRNTPTDATEKNTQDSRETVRINEETAKTEGSTPEMTFPLPDINSLVQYSKIDIPNPDSDRGYKINTTFAKYNQQSQVMVYGKRGRDIRILDIRTGSIIDKHTSECELWNLESASPNEYVAVSMSRKLHILNSTFKIVATLESNKNVKCVACLNNHRFLLLEYENDYQSISLSIIKIRDKQLIRESSTSLVVNEMIDSIAVSSKYAYMHSAKYLYIVRLSDWKNIHADISSVTTGPAWSLCHVGNSLLVGDGYGKVHMMNENLNYIKTIIRLPWMTSMYIIPHPTGVAGIAVRDGSLVLTSRKNDVLLYK